MSAESPFLPALLLLFVGSGAAALIYQIVWFQMLSLIIGSSAISLGLLLATFMGGMCIGSLGLPYVIPAHRHPLRVYAMIEAPGAEGGLYRSDDAGGRWTLMNNANSRAFAPSTSTMST